MPPWLSIHQPVLVNTIGHCAGALIFGMLLYLFFINHWRAREEGTKLPMVAAALAMLWNIGSLIALATGPAGGKLAAFIVPASFSVLSLLPAVLLHISLDSKHRALWLSGYVLSSIAIGLHLADLVARTPRFHYAALLLVTLGFAALTAISVVLELRMKNRAAVSRLVGSMGLFLLAISFVHFGSEHGGMAWSKEVALHHAGLPLALLVLLQDYRFLLLDAFLRFVVNASLAAAALLTAIRVLESPQLVQHLQHPFDAGLLFASGCLLLLLFVYIRNRTQRWLTHVIFLRSNIDEPVRELHQMSRATSSENEYIRLAAHTIAGFVRARRFELTETNPVTDGELIVPRAVLEQPGWNLPHWVHAVVPLRFSRGDSRYLLLGPRDGGRRYLSEDFAELVRLGTAVVEEVEQLRALQMQNLVSQAELRALQAQINPHFLFNSLNTLYGTIDRTNAEARRLVLNLSEVFRYLLRSDRTFIEIEEELRIVRAYLEIEALRLGPKLQTAVEVDSSVLHASVPLLSIQPLVENAVKHGVAARMGTGFVRLSICLDRDNISVQVLNSGECDTRAWNASGGVGLSNVRRRLALCYGAEARFNAYAANGNTTVGFVLPLRILSSAAAVATAG